MTHHSPLAHVKEKFGSKEELVKKVSELATGDLWLDRTNKDKGLAHLSNAKLQRLHTVLSSVKERFGNRSKLVDAVANAQGHGKDADYKKGLAAWPLPRLLDALQSGERRSKRAAKKPAAK